MPPLWPLEHLERLAPDLMLEPAHSSSVFADVAPSWHRWITVGLDLLFPPLCPLCRSRLGAGRRDPLCGSCWERLPRLTPPYCARCGRPFYTFAPDAPHSATPPGTTAHPAIGSLAFSETGPSCGLTPGLCEPCHRQPPPFAYARAAALYQGAVREALHAFKFGGRSALARPLGDLLAEAGHAMLPRQTVDWLVPVPLHPAREAERGFNQSLLLTRRLSQRWRVPVAKGVLKRVRVTRPQTELSAAERHANVRGAFVLHRPLSVAGAHVLLVDDIVTTGATVSECCRTLLSAGGVSTVGVLTVARVP